MRIIDRKKKSYLNKYDNIPKSFEKSIDQISDEQNSNEIKGGLNQNKEIPLINNTNVKCNINHLSKFKIEISSINIISKIIN